MEIMNVDKKIKIFAFHFKKSENYVLTNKME